MRQKLGQHFLINAEVLRGIAASAAPQPDETVIEIGPGHGELTQFLLERQPRRLIVIERDGQLAEDLQENFRDTLEIRAGDVLKILPELAAELSGRGIAYSLAGNIPYYLTGFLFRVIAGLDHKPVRSVFTMQKEVAERLVKKPPGMNRLAAAVQWWSEPRIIGLISRADFDPKPDVDSATVLAETKHPAPSQAESDRYYAALHALFQQPRKTITNNIQSSTDLPKEEISGRLREINLDPGLRAQDLDIKEIAAIGLRFVELRPGNADAVVE